MNLNLIKASAGTGEPVKATITVDRASGSATNTVDAVTNWPTNFIATSGLQITDSNGNKTLDPATILVYAGHKSGSTVIIDTIAAGYTDPARGNKIGDVIIIKPTTMWVDNLADFLAVSHTDLGLLNTAAIAQVAAAIQGTEIRLQPRLSTTTSTATLSPNIDTDNTWQVSAQAVGLAIANPSGTAKDGDVLLFRIKDNGTSRAISYGTAYSNVSGLDLLTATTANKWHYIGVQYNLAAAKWHIISMTTEA